MRGSSDFLTLNSGLARDRRSRCDLSPLRNVRATIRQFASALVTRGRPIEEITSLATLVEFDGYKDGLRFFLERNGGSPPTWLSGMAATLLAIARHHVKLPPEEIERLSNIKRRLKVDRPDFTDKNKQRLAQFDDPYNVELLMLLPRRLVDRAERSNTKSSRTALDVMHAVAIRFSSPFQCEVATSRLSTLNAISNGTAGQRPNHLAGDPSFRGQEWATDRGRLFEGHDPPNPDVSEVLSPSCGPTILVIGSFRAELEDLARTASRTTWPGSSTEKPDLS